MKFRQVPVGAIVKIAPNDFEQVVATRMTAGRGTSKKSFSFSTAFE
jgi:hypothetical protein